MDRCQLNSSPDCFVLLLCLCVLKFDGSFLHSNGIHRETIWVSDSKWTHVLTVTSSSAFHCLTWTKTVGFSSAEPWPALWIDTFNHSIYIRHSEEATQIFPPHPISLKYSHLPEAPPSTPSPFSPLKSTGHVCFIKNDKCCSLAVPLQNSHLSWPWTFQSCQLFHLTWTQILQKMFLVGGVR